MYVNHFHCFKTPSVTFDLDVCLIDAVELCDACGCGHLEWFEPRTWPFDGHIERAAMPKESQHASTAVQSGTEKSSSDTESTGSPSTEDTIQESTKKKLKSYLKTLGSAVILTLTLTQTLHPNPKP